MIHMTRRKKHQKLPNGFGSIKYLGKGRYKPYGVYPPIENILLPDQSHQRHLPTLKHGMKVMRFLPQGKWSWKEKYMQELKAGTKKTASMNSTQAAFKNSSALHGMQFGQIRYRDMQDILNNCELKHSSQELIVSLMHQMYKYAIKYDIVDKDYSTALFIPIPDDDQNGVPFTDDELKLLWENKDDSIIEMVLIMCYSGFRIKAFTNMETNLKEQYFKGGVKTRASKERIVPIHPAIYDMVKARCNGKNLLHCSANDFRQKCMTHFPNSELPMPQPGKNIPRTIAATRFPDFARNTK